MYLCFLLFGLSRVFLHQKNNETRKREHMNNYNQTKRINKLLVIWNSSILIDFSKHITEHTHYSKYEVGMDLYNNA